MAAFSKDDINSLRSTYYGEVQAGLANNDLNLTYYGQVIAIDMETAGAFPIGLWMSLSTGWGL